MKTAVLAFALITLGMPIDRCRIEVPQPQPPSTTAAPTPAPTPEPTPESSPTPTPTPPPETPGPTPPVLPTPAESPTPVEAPPPTPTATPPDQVCGRELPDTPVAVVGPPCPRGFVLVSNSRQGYTVCVAASACGWDGDHPGPSIRPNMRCDLMDLSLLARTMTDDTSCWHWPERLRRGFSLRKGLMCEYDDPDAPQGCSDAYGRRVLGRELVCPPKDPKSWGYHGWCPSQWAVPCPEGPTPTQPPDPPQTPIPGVPVASCECPPARIGVSPALSCQVRQGKLVCGGDTTARFCPGGDCTRGVACDDGPNAVDRTKRNYEVNCNGCWCEPPDTGPNALRLTWRASPGVEVSQEGENAYHYKLKAPEGTDSFWAEACLAAGNIGRSGTPLRLSGNPCSRREWVCGGTKCGEVKP